MKNIFLWTITVFSNKKLVRRVAFRRVLLSLHYRRIEHSWILTSAPTFRLLQYLLRAEVQWRTPILVSVAGKGRSIWTAVFRYVGTCFFDTSPKPDSWEFLRLVTKWNLKPYQLTSHSCENETYKDKHYLSIITNIVLTSQIPWRGLGNLQGFPDLTWELLK